MSAQAFPLDGRQRAAVQDDGDKIVAVGRHGTGKTHVAVGRVAFLLGQGVPPGEITCLAATDQNANDLRRRMGQFPFIAASEHRLFVGTVSQLCNEVLRNGGSDVLGLSSGYTILDRRAALQMLRWAWKARGGRRLEARQLRAILDWRRGNLRRWPDSPPAPAREDFWLEVEDVYVEELALNAAVEMDDLPAKAHRALSDDNFRRLWPSGRARHLVMDDPEQYTAREVAVLDLLTGTTASLMATAECDSQGSLVALSAPFRYLLLPGGSSRYHHLTVNHAQTRRLFRLGAALRSGLEGFDQMTMAEDPGGPVGEPPLLVEVDGIQEDMDRWCLEGLQRWAQQGIPWDQMAVLDRHGRALGRMRTQLAHRNIPYRVLGADPPDRPTDARCIVALLTLLLNPWDLRSGRIAAGAGWPNRDRLMPEAAALEWRRTALEAGSHLVDAARHLLSVPGRGAPEQHQLGQLVRAWEELTRSLAPWQENAVAALSIGARNMINSFKAAGLPIFSETETVDFLSHFLFIPRWAGESHRDHLCRVLDLWSPALHPARLHENRTGVTFGRFGAVTGLNWQAVQILDVSDGAIPGDMGSYSEVVAREFALFRQAVTRATRCLQMCYLADMGKGGRRYAPSRFLEPVQNLLQFRREPYQAPPPSEDPFAGPGW